MSRSTAFAVACLSVLALAQSSIPHETEHHKVAKEILEEVQGLRDDIDEVLESLPEPDDGVVGEGEVAADCIKMWWDSNGYYLYYRNECSYTVSVAYCDLDPYWSFEDSCGENRNSSQPFYTDVKHLCPGDQNRWYRPGEINWAACKGFLNVRDSGGEFTSDANGDYACNNDPSGYDPCQ